MIPQLVSLKRDFNKSWAPIVNVYEKYMGKKCVHKKTNKIEKWNGLKSSFSMRSIA